jgi:hypothetical protein
MRAGKEARKVGYLTEGNRTRRALTFWPQEELQGPVCSPVVRKDSGQVSESSKASDAQGYEC